MIACPACSCHAHASEESCPHCEAPLRKANGAVERTAASVMLGLAVTVVAPTALSGCSDETKGSASSSSSASSMEASSVETMSVAAAYGIAVTGVTGPGVGGSGGMAGQGGASSQGGAGGK